MWHFGTACNKTDILLTHAFKLFGAMAADASAELIFLLTREKVDESIQNTLYTAGVISIRKFSALVNDEAELREMAKTHLGLGECKTLKDKVKISA